MAQMGHSDASLALEVYTKVMERKRDTGIRMDALIRGADWAPMGTSSSDSAARPVPIKATQKVSVQSLLGCCVVGGEGIGVRSAK